MPEGLRCAFVAGLSDVPPLPLHVRDLEEGDIVFEADLVKLVKRKIVCHRFTKVLGGDVKLSQFRRFHRALM